MQYFPHFFTVVKHNQSLSYFQVIYLPILDSDKCMVNLHRIQVDNNFTAIKHYCRTL